MLTNEQRLRILSYRSHWQQVARSTTRIEQNEAIATIRHLYQRFGLRSPQVIVMPSPEAAKVWMMSQMRSTWLRRSPWRWLSLLPILSLSCVAFFIGFFVGVVLFELIFPPVIKWLKPLPDWLTFIPEYLLAVTLICIMLSLPFYAMGKSIQWLMRGRAVLKNISVRLRFGEAIAPKISEDLFDPLIAAMRSHCCETLLTQADDLLLESPKQVYSQVWARVNTALCEYWNRKTEGFFSTLQVQQMLLPLPTYLEFCSQLDFYLDELGCKTNQQDWQLICELARHCGWVIPMKKICILCDRPVQLKFDEQGQLHSDGTPAIEWSDGERYFFHHGLEIFEFYGRIPSSEWKPEWTVTERNEEMRRILTRKIGYRRMCEELPTIQIDEWYEYILLEIDSKKIFLSNSGINALPPIDFEPIMLLKMTCPDTGQVNVMQVPNYIQSAIEAVNWVDRTEQEL